MSEADPDYFAVLGFPRRPWLDSELVTARFRELSKTLHPDRVAAASAADAGVALDRYTRLNAGYQCLVDPQRRLFYLLELQAGIRAGEARSVPAEFAEAFMEISAMLKSADRLIEQSSMARSPIAQARRAGERLEFAGQLEAWRARIRERQESCHAQIRGLDERWATVGLQEEIVRELVRLAHVLAFLNRWGAQLERRLQQLTLGGTF